MVPWTRFLTAVLLLGLLSAGIIFRDFELLSDQSSAGNGSVEEASMVPGSLQLSSSPGPRAARYCLKGRKAWREDSPKIPFTSLDGTEGLFPIDQELPVVTPFDPASPEPCTDAPLSSPIRLLFFGQEFGEPVSDASKTHLAQRTIAGCPVPCEIDRPVDVFPKGEDQGRFARADAVIIHGPDAYGWGGDWFRDAKDRLRPVGQPWVLFSLESPSNYPGLADPQWMEPFNWTYQYWSGAAWPSSWSPLVPTDGPVQGATFSYESLAEARTDPPEGRTGKLFCLYSNCASKNSREAVAESLMAALGPGWVDCMGKCMHNKEFPSDVPEHHIYKAGRTNKRLAIKQRLQKSYKFDLVMQNSNCFDWVDEKIYETLAVGLVPVFLGAFNIQDFLIPGYKMAVTLHEFGNNITAVAEHLKYLDANATAYNEYFTWHEAVRARPGGNITLPLFLPRTVSNLNPYCYLCQRVVDARLKPAEVHRARPNRSCCDNGSNAGCLTLRTWEKSDLLARPKTPFGQALEWAMGEKKK